MASAHVTRRTFLKVAAAAPYVVASTTLGAGGAWPASERIGMGFIGLGGRGGGTLKHFLRPGVSEPVAVCDVWKSRAEAWRGRLSAGVAAYQDFRDLVARRDVDAVVVAVDLHCYCCRCCSGCGPRRRATNSSGVGTSHWMRIPRCPRCDPTRSG